MFTLNYTAFSCIVLGMMSVTFVLSLRYIQYT